MNSFTINMRNSTQAYRARAVLSRRRIPAAVERSHSNRGCSFRLRVHGDRKEVCALLAAAGIPCDIS